MSSARMVFGDCVGHMRSMPEGSVDLAVFDPPYKTIGGGTPDDPKRPKGVLESNSKTMFAHNSILPETYLPELYRVLRPEAHVYMMTNFLWLKNGIMGKLESAGFQIHNLLVWRKNTANPNRWYMKDLEYTLFARKGKAFPINRPGTRSSLSTGYGPQDFLFYPETGDLQPCFDYPVDWDNPKSPKPHPTAKPVGLMETYIQNSSAEGDTVLDLFAGAGSTGVAASNLNRKFIGCEIDMEYFEVACARLGLDVSEQTENSGIRLSRRARALFGPAAPVTKKPRRSAPI